MFVLFLRHLMFLILKYIYILDIFLIINVYFNLLKFNKYLLNAYTILSTNM